MIATFGGLVLLAVLLTTISAPGKNGTARWVWLKIRRDRVMQVLVFVSICQGAILVPLFSATARSVVDG